MKEFNWEQFKNLENEIAVHCKTEEEAKDFCKQMHMHGMSWKDRSSYLIYINHSKYKEETCYYSDGCFSGMDFANKHNYTILEWSDYMKKDFKCMTVEEMRQKLEELTGEKIEVCPSRGEMIGVCNEFCRKQCCSSDCVLDKFGDCLFQGYSDKKLKQCYEKILGGGKD